MRETNSDTVRARTRGNKGECLRKKRRLERERRDGSSGLSVAGLVAVVLLRRRDSALGTEGLLLALELARLLNERARRAESACAHRTLDISSRRSGERRAPTEDQRGRSTHRQGRPRLRCRARRSAGACGSARRTAARLGRCRRAAARRRTGRSKCRGARVRGGLWAVQRQLCAL